jgi:serine/threonine-protein kinase
VGVPFGRYRLLDKVGSGAVADIFRAIALGAQGFERMVAIKRIREEASEVADIGKLFADEARVSALLEHPNIVQVYDFGVEGGIYYIAMEYLKGKNLHEVLTDLRAANERLSPSLAVFVAREVARGLSYAHAFRDERGRRMNIVHRDVAPPNIMLVHAGAVKLLDFGMARVTSELRQSITRGRGRKIKYPYVSPEQISGGNVDARSDIFSLGAVLWEMLTGQRLFGGDTDLEIMASVIGSEIVAPSKVVPGLPDALDRISLTALARDPRNRYASADAFAADLETVMRTLPSRHADLSTLLARLGGAPVTPRELKPVLASFNDTVVDSPLLRREGETQWTAERTASNDLRADGLTQRISGTALPTILEERSVTEPTRHSWTAGRGPLFAGLAAVAFAGVVIVILGPSRQSSRWERPTPVRRSPVAATTVHPVITPLCVPAPIAAPVVAAPAPPAPEMLPPDPEPPTEVIRPARVARAKKLALSASRATRPRASRTGAHDATNLHVDPFAE